MSINPLSANITKWSSTPKLPTNCLSVFDHFVELALIGLIEFFTAYYFCRKVKNLRKLLLTFPFLLLSYKLNCGTQLCQFLKPIKFQEIFITLQPQSTASHKQMPVFPYEKKIGHELKGGYLGPVS